MRVVVIAAILLPLTAHAERELCRRGASYHGAPIDLDVKAADIHDVMRLLADVGRVNIVVPDTVRGKVTLRLRRVAWDLAACTIASMHKLTLVARDNVILVRSRDDHERRASGAPSSTNSIDTEFRQ